MPRVIFVRVGGTDDDPRFGLLDADDVKAVNGQNTIVADVMGERAKRTLLQNKSIHKYCSLLADAFNAAGLDMLAVLKVKRVSVSWTMQSCKDVLWRPIQLAMFNKESTTALETDEVSKVYEQLARHLAENFNIDQSFPSRFGD